jgi:hypothetical protein
MPIDLSIGRWVNVVAAGQWQREDADLAAVGGELPQIIATSRALAEVHRLDLSLFTIFEEASLRVSGALTRRAPTLEALNFASQQTIDEARHHEIFRRRLDQSRAVAGISAEQSIDAIMIPPLRTFIDRCYEVADGDSFIEGLTLMNLVLEGMAYPLYEYEERYWRPIDPYLAQLVHSAFADETRHVAFGAQIVRELLADDVAHRNRVAVLCREAREAMKSIFHYYVRKFVGLFDAVARRHQDLFRGAEFAPGRLISETPYAEQVAIIQATIEREHTRLIERAGVS